MEPKQVTKLSDLTGSLALNSRGATIEHGIKALYHLPGWAAAHVTGLISGAWANHQLKLTISAVMVEGETIKRTNGLEVENLAVMVYYIVNHYETGLKGYYHLNFTGSMETFKGQLRGPSYRVTHKEIKEGQEAYLEQMKWDRDNLNYQVYSEFTWVNEP